MMYCRDCGAQIIDGDKFCVHCGTSADGRISVTRSDRKYIYRYIAMGLAILSIILVFFDWFKIPALDMLEADSHCSLFDILFSAKQITDVIGLNSKDAGTIALVSVLLAVLIASVLTGNAIFLYRLAKKYDRSIGVGKFAFVTSIVLPALLMIAVFAINRYVKEGTEGWLQTIIEITVSPVLMLAAGGIGRAFIIAGIRKEVPENTTRTSLNMGELVIAVLYTAVGLFTLFLGLGNIQYHHPLAWSQSFDIIFGQLVWTAARAVFIVAVVKRGIFGNTLTGAALLAIAFLSGFSLNFAIDPLYTVITLLGIVKAGALLAAGAAYLSGKKIQGLRMAMAGIIAVLAIALCVLWSSFTSLSDGLWNGFVSLLPAIFILLFTPAEQPRHTSEPPERLNAGVLAMAVLCTIAMSAASALSLLQHNVASATLAIASAMLIAGVIKRDRAGNIFAGMGLLIAGYSLIPAAVYIIIAGEPFQGIIYLLLAGALIASGVVYLSGRNSRNMRTAVMIILIAAAIGLCAISPDTPVIIQSLGFAALGICIRLFAPAEARTKMDVTTGQLTA